MIVSIYQKPQEGILLRFFNIMIKLKDILWTVVACITS